MTKNLQKYIKEKRKEGNSYKEIKEKLLDVGHEEEMVNKAISKMKHKKLTTSLIIPFAILAILIIILTITPKANHVEKEINNTNTTVQKETRQNAKNLTEKEKQENKDWTIMSKAKYAKDESLCRKIKTESIRKECLKSIN